jgi:hypothetical protein
MTYPDIAPKLRVEETISNPFDPAEILGFTGRNKMLGDSAVIVKEAALAEDDNGPVVQIPRETADLIADETAEFVVLLEDTVLAMTSTDFATEHRLPSVHRGGKTVEMADVSLSNEMFRQFPRGAVEVSN